MGRMDSARVKAAADWLASIAMIAVAVSLWTGHGLRGVRTPTAPEPAPLPSEPILIAGNASIGSSVASTVVIAFSDFQCPYCAQFAKVTWPRLNEKYVSTGKVQFVFKHLPLDEIHPLAVGAAAGAQCAYEQNRFEAMHDLLFAGGRELSPIAVREAARDVGLDLGQYDTCVTSTGPDRVSQDSSEGSKLKVAATPTLFLGHRTAEGGVRVLIRVDGMVPFEQLERMLTSKTINVDGK